MSATGKVLNISNTRVSLLLTKIRQLPARLLLPGKLESLFHLKPLRLPHQKRTRSGSRFTTLEYAIRMPTLSLVNDPSCSVMG